MRLLPLAAVLAATLSTSPVLISNVYAAEAAVSAVAKAPQDHVVTSEHSIRLHGDKLSYTATTGTMIIRNDKNEADASVFYVAYTKPAKKGEHRPVTFLFNGGPGSSTLWLHMGSFGPKRIKTENAAPTGPAPYELVDNQFTLLDKTDLVFIDAFGTGYSRGIATKENADSKDDPAKHFWGVDGDVDGFARFITRYVTVNQRWNSPKFVIGESYGTIRAPALVNKLQGQGMDFNGIVLVSSILNYSERAPGLDRQYVGILPTFAAVAWYQNKLPNKPAKLEPFLDEVRAFAENDYAIALAQGHNLPADKLQQIAEKLHQYTGLDTQYLKNANLRIDQGQFRKELLRDEHRTLGRYDGRYLGIDDDAIGATPDTDPSSTAPSGAYIAGLHNYLETELKYTTDEHYKVSSFDAYKNWDWTHAQGGNWGYQYKTRAPYVVRDLGDAIRTNPGLHVLSTNGYFDMATPFHSTEYDLAHMNLDPSLRKNVEMTYYPSGHMIYLNEKALVDFHKDVAAFYDKAQTK
ncbi:peptidase S10 [Shewanella mangrovi]|uniref:Peptidase S10 n=1 Tax=Shewanella mangrovi TaxID=1515746 RepID=A0A094LPF7_9GAMM|nr:peptidase S10 [Shewanella mangrovi]KFZ37038.1 peptidase S10 [Shewanella mangrovi]